MDKNISRWLPRARDALAALPAGQPEARAVLSKMLEDIDAGQHPGLDPTACERILQALRAIVEYHGMRAVYSSKYGYTRVEINGDGPGYKKLIDLAAMVELVTDRELQKSGGISS